MIFSDNEKKERREYLIQEMQINSNIWQGPYGTIEGYVKGFYEAESWNAEDTGNKMPAYSKYLLSYFELISDIQNNKKTKRSLGHNINYMLQKYKNGQFHATQDGIECESSNGKTYDLIYTKNPNFLERASMIWCLKKKIGETLDYQDDRFEDLVDLIYNIEETSR